MSERRTFRLLQISLLALTVSLLFCANSFAQAWLPPAGEAFISISYGNAFVTRHYIGTPTDPGDSVATDRGHVRSQKVGADLGYAITDRFLVVAGLPYVYAKWYPFEGLGRPHDSRVDNNDYHGTFQDYRFGAFYQVLREPLVLTPFVGAVIPSHDYKYFAHSAVGRNLHEYLFGVDFGSRIDRILPGSYIEGRYSYAFVERVLDTHHDRSDGVLEVGYFLTPSLGVRLMTSGFYTHGGLVFKQPADFGTPLDASNPIYLHHDQIGHDSALSVGGGLSYALTGSVDVYGTYLRQVAGHGGHRIDHGINFGVSWGFSPQRVVRRLFGPKIPVGEPPIQP
jgi:hypothetical protein